MSPIEVGILPFNLLLNTLIAVNLVNFPMVDGIVPLKRLLIINKLVNENMFPINVGILAFKLLLFAFKTTKLVSFTMSDGILPLKQLV
jgi:hypothetical protein